MLREVVLALDELEALRLADLEGLYQERAAERMGVSRSTFARTVEVARRKIAEVLIGGLALRIEGGPVHLVGGAPGARQRRRRGRFGAGAAACPRCGWGGPDDGRRGAAAPGQEDAGDPDPDDV
jgi:predicted DNA-binding protein (UPF0251 family)